MTLERSEFRAGWRNLAAATIGIGLGVPCYTPISSLFFHSLVQEFGWSRTVAAGALIAMPLTAIALPFAGVLVDRIGVRIATFASVMALVASCFWLASLGQWFINYYAALISLNVLGCVAGPIGYTRLVAAQFRKSRGTALAVSQFGVACAGMFLPPVVGFLIATKGWRVAYIALAAAILMAGLVAQLLMQPAKATSSAGAGTGVSGYEALRDRHFWQLGIAILAISIGALGLVTQFQSVLIDRGIEIGTATLLISVLSLSVAISRLVVGRLLDLSRPAWCAAGVLAVAALGALLMFAGWPGIVATVVAVSLFGVSIGAELDLMAFFCARIFGMRHYSQIYGMLAMFFYSGTALGGIAYGALRDRTGSYDTPLLISVAMLLLAALMFLILDDRMRETTDAVGRDDAVALKRSRSAVRLNRALGR